MLFDFAVCDLAVEAACRNESCVGCEAALVATLQRGEASVGDRRRAVTQISLRRQASTAAESVGVSPLDDAANEILALLAEDADDVVRHEVARCPGLPLALIHRLALHPDPLTRRCLGKRNDLDVHLAELLSLDSDTSTRCRVFYNRHAPIPPCRFAAMAHESDMQTRFYAARHPACPNPIRLAFVFDQAPAIQDIGRGCFPSSC